jgi:hypothetical protein
MMTDKRSFDGWSRLGAKVMADVGDDDPAGLRQVRDELDRLERQYTIAMAMLAGEYCPCGGRKHTHYSHGEIARELGVTRQAVSKRIAALMAAESTARAND